MGVRTKPASRIVKVAVVSKVRHLNYSQIDEFIYIGTTICCRHHLDDLIKLGIQADVDLQEEKQDKPSGVTSFLWLPTIDFQPPSQAQLWIGAHFIADLVVHRTKCYVHCNAGFGRAPTMVAAYYMLALGIKPEAAVAKIKKKREGIGPNERQLTALRIFYRSIRRHFALPPH